MKQKDIAKQLSLTIIPLRTPYDLPVIHTNGITNENTFRHIPSDMVSAVSTCAIAEIVRRMDRNWTQNELSSSFIGIIIPRKILEGYKARNKLMR